MRTAIPALLLVLALVLLGLGIRKIWRESRGMMDRAVALGPVSSGLVPRLAWAALFALVAWGGITRLVAP
jgi:hypothetical protein